MPLNKLDSFTFNYSDQVDKLYEVKTSTQVKQAFDSRGEELKELVNNNVDVMNTEFATKALVQAVTLGQIPDNTLNEAKMANDMKKQSGGVAKYDDLVTLNTDYIAFKATKGQANGIGSLNNDGRIPFSQAPSIALDSGRYQSQYSFDKTETYVNTAFDNVQSVSLNVADGTTTIGGTITNSGLSGSSNGGLKFHTNKALNGIKVSLHVWNSGATRLQILNSSKSVLYTMDITGLTGTITVPFTLSANTDYYVSVDNNGSTWSMAYTVSNVAYPFNGTDLNIIGAIYNGNDDYCARVFSTITSIIPAITGTITKTYSLPSIVKYSNLKTTVANLNSNNSAIITIKSISDAQLIAPVTLVNGINIIDLSTIDSVSYPSIKVLITLNRNTISDLNPTISNFSVTWEGKDNRNNVGLFTDTSTSIPANGTYIKTVPLGITAQKGRILFQGYYGTYSDKIAYLIFDTNSSNTFGWWLDGSLTTTQIRCGNGQFMGAFDTSGSIVLQSMNIVGNNLVITFKNNYTSAITLNIIKAKWEVEG